MILSVLLGSQKLRQHRRPLEEIRQRLQPFALVVLQHFLQPVRIARQDLLHLRLPLRPVRRYLAS